MGPRQILSTVLFLLLMMQHAQSQWLTTGNNINNTNSGNVGIGTASPNYLLDVNGIAHAATFMATAPSGGIAANFRGTGNSSINLEGANGSIFWITATTGGLFKIGGNGGTDPAAGVLNISNLNLVGIGTASPQATLHVQGSALGSAAGNTSELTRFTGSDVGNTAQLSILTNRFAAGSDWTSASTRIQMVTDVSKQGYIDFNPGGPSTAIAFGYNGSEFVRINANGSMGVGTTNTGSNKFAVEGAIGARKVIVTATNPFPDYVFRSGYSLIPLDSIAGYIQANGRLPEMPSADSVTKHGLDLGNNQVLLLKKIEELTLYVIGQQKQIGKLKEQNTEMKELNKKLEARIDQLSNTVAEKKRG